ncbi:MAG TPA: hypothetical protein VGE62_01490 [Candidatus Paceibacterota bacterium]
MQKGGINSLVTPIDVPPDAEFLIKNVHSGKGCDNGHYQGSISVIRTVGEHLKVEERERHFTFIVSTLNGCRIQCNVYSSSGDTVGHAEKLGESFIDAPEPGTGNSRLCEHLINALEEIKKQAEENRG